MLYSSVLFYALFFWFNIRFYLFFLESFNYEFQPYLPLFFSLIRLKMMTNEQQNSKLKVTKRDGSLEEFDFSKISRVINFAAEGLDVSTSQVEMGVQTHVYNGVFTSDIHDTVTKAAADLISVENPDYEFMAARLALYQMRKQAYGDYTPPHLEEHIRKQVEAKRYHPDLINLYTSEEIDELNKAIVHERDTEIAYAGIMQIIGKYAVKDKSKGNQFCLETPQMIFMLTAMSLFSMEKENRFEKVKSYYDEISKRNIALSTPLLAGVRTLTKQFSSCVLIDSEDSLDGINSSSNAIVKYVAQRAGIGINIGRIRAVNSIIRHGEATHTGILPFIKLFEAAVASCNQGKKHCPA